MPFNFAKAYPTHRYQDGDIFLGVDDDNHEIGVTLETNALTIGGSGAGKGAALLITNARRWPHSLVCIDPKGENTALTWEARRDMGQVVGALDPFHVAKDCEEIRVSINPLQGIREDDPRARATILAIANGLIVSHDPKHMEWTEGARKIWAGLIAYNASEAPAEYRTFKALRDMIMQPDTLADGSGGLYEDAQAMAASQAFGGLVRSAGIAIMTAIEKGKGMERDFLGLAQRATQWLDDPAIAAALGSSTFDLDDLLTGRATLYLVLPADDVSEYAGFLRLFIKSTLRTMGKQSTLSGADKAECLYLLDEFYSLGKLEEAQEATGRMRGYGVHLWPFVQNMGQISSLYGKDGVETFFTNSDCHLFLGNDQDHTALEYISNRIGKNTPEDIGETPPHRHTATKRNPDARSPFGYRPSGFPFETATERRSKIDTEDENARRATDALNAKNEADYQHKMRMVGQARLSPDEIAAIVGKGKGDKLARHIIAFIKGGDVLKLKPAPYFEPRRRNMMEQTAPVLNPILNYLHEARQEVREWPQEARNFVPIGIIGFISCMALAISLMRLYQGEGDSQTNIMIAIISGIIAAPIGLYMIKIARE